MEYRFLLVNKIEYGVACATHDRKTGKKICSSV